MIYVLKAQVEVLESFVRNESWALGLEQTFAWDADKPLLIRVNSMG